MDRYWLLGHYFALWFLHIGFLEALRLFMNNGNDYNLYIYIVESCFSFFLNEMLALWSGHEANKCFKISKLNFQILYYKAKIMIFKYMCLVVVGIEICVFFLYLLKNNNFRYCWSNVSYKFFARLQSIFIYNISKEKKNYYE